jgi:hypothetical protein
MNRNSRGRTRPLSYEALESRQLLHGGRPDGRPLLPPTDMRLEPMGANRPPADLHDARRSEAPRENAPQQVTFGLNPPDSSSRLPSNADPFALFVARTWLPSQGFLAEVPAEPSRQVGEPANGQPDRATWQLPADDVTRRIEPQQNFTESDDEQLEHDDDDRIERERRRQPRTKPLTSSLFLRKDRLGQQPAALDAPRASLRQDSPAERAPAASVTSRFMDEELIEILAGEQVANDHSLVPSGADESECRDAELSVIELAKLHDWEPLLPPTAVVATSAVIMPPAPPVRAPSLPVAVSK